MSKDTALGGIDVGIDEDVVAGNQANVTIVAHAESLDDGVLDNVAGRLSGLY